MRSRRFFAIGFLVVAMCTVSPSQAELIGAWDFEEGTGDTAFNSVAGGADGQINNHLTGGLGGGSVWVDDPVRGSVISFGGGEGATAGDVYAGDLPVLTMTNDFSWAFWANNAVDPDFVNPNHIVVGNRVNFAGADFSPREFVKFTPRAFEWHVNGGDAGNVTYPEIMPQGEWVHHAVVKTGDELQYYRAGELQTAVTTTITGAPANPQPLFFGGDNSSGAGEHWLGLLDEVRIYDNALDAAAVRQLAGVIPEPSAIFLLLAGSTCLLGALRRRS